MILSVSWSFHNKVSKYYGFNNKFSHRYKGQKSEINISAGLFPSWGLRG